MTWSPPDLCFKTHRNSVREISTCKCRRASDQLSTVSHDRIRVSLAASLPLNSLSQSGHSKLLFELTAYEAIAEQATRLNTARKRSVNLWQHAWDDRADAISTACSEAKRYDTP